MLVCWLVLSELSRELFSKKLHISMHTRLTESEYLRVMPRNVYFYIVTQMTPMHSQD